MDNDETNHRTIHPPFDSPGHHFFNSPEPQHMAANLYPEGPSCTARHVPEHFVQNVLYADDDGGRSIYASSARGASSDRALLRPGSPSVDSASASGTSRYRAQSARGGGSFSSRNAPICVWDGSRVSPVSEIFDGKDTRGPRDTTSPHAQGVSRVKMAGRNLPAEGAGSWDFRNAPGKPPPQAVDRSPDTGHIYKSHAQMAYDKHLCQAHAYRHCDRWERIEAGSNGHSINGSDFGSEAGRSRASRSSVSMDPARRQRRSRSEENAQKSSRKGPRAASTERFNPPRRREGRDSGRDTPNPRSARR
jgi:hypothetical protein